MPKGRIKAGEGTLIGNAGEHYVLAELLKRGIIAAMTPRNTPSIDILATKHGKSIRIRVKTKSQEYSDWQWMVKKDGAIFRDVTSQGDFTILVDLAMDIRDMRFFILPTRKVETWLKTGFEKWLQTPGMKGKRHDPKNPKRNLPYEEQALSKYLNNWDILWK